jgi:hypothetical protein
MNPTSQNQGAVNLPFSSGHTPMDNRTLYLTLVASAVLGLMFILILYVAVFGGDPVARVPFGLLISVPPALGALLVVKLTRVFDSWRGAFIVYLALFALAAIIQALGRNIPV